MLITLGDKAPAIDASAWVAADAMLSGDVQVGADSSIWYSTVIRGDGDTITIGARSNIQDGSVMHTDPGLKLVVGNGVSVGHRAVLHGCVIEDDCLIGMGAIVMNGARIGAGSLVAAGALVLEGTVIPPRSVVMGSPGKVRSEVSDEALVMLQYNATHYVGLKALHAGG